MSREEAIEKFGIACRRGLIIPSLIEVQYCRTRWQFEFGEARYCLDFNDGQPTLKIYPFIGTEDVIYAINGTIDFKLTLFEYVELEKKYLNGIEPDYAYMLRWYGKEYIIKTFGIEYLDLVSDNLFLKMKRKMKNYKNSLAKWFTLRQGKMKYE